MRILLAIVLLLSALAPAIGSDCVEIKGKTYCAEEDTTKVSIGGVELQVTNPLDLLTAAKKDQVGRLHTTSLWDTYEYPPFLMELAKQNEMEVEELIDHIAHQWDSHEFNWALALQELPDALDQLSRILQPEQVDQVVSDILTAVMDDVIKQISVEYEGVSV